MKVRLPRRFEIDTNNVPKNFENEIRRIFSEYTEGTHPDYTFEDKLLFIDRCIDAFHGKKDSYEAVTDLLMNHFSHDVADGELPDKRDYNSIDFMVQCYELGKESQLMYSDYGKDKHDKAKVEKIIIQLIKTVLDWE